MRARERHDLLRQRCSPWPRMGPLSGKWRSSLVVCVSVLACITAACLPDPQRVQPAALFDQLVSARAMFGEQPPRAEQACELVGTVQTRLSGEPGLAEVRAVWPALRDAAVALEAVCGQSTMLSQPATDALA